MPIRPAAVLAAALCLGLAGPALAQDAVAGKVIADTWCSNCHAVGTGPQAKGTDAVPGFAAIAAMPATTEMSLTAFLTTPHPRMPNFTLSRAEVGDVAAYILSLRAKR